MHCWGFNPFSVRKKGKGTPNPNVGNPPKGGNDNTSGQLRRRVQHLNKKKVWEEKITWKKEKPRTFGTPQRLLFRAGENKKKMTERENGKKMSPGFNAPEKSASELGVVGGENAGDYTLRASFQLETGGKEKNRWDRRRKKGEGCIQIFFEGNPGLYGPWKTGSGKSAYYRGASIGGKVLRDLGAKSVGTTPTSS